MTTQHTTLLTGIPVGQYEVVREIGRGAVAVVYLANQPGLGRQVALKELSAVHAHEQAFAERFLREARIAGSLNHANIVSVFDYFEIDSVPYIAMEYLANGSLRRHMPGLGLAEQGLVLDSLLSALAHAGQQGIVHRDIKPENLLVGADGVVKVADFGVAKALYSASDYNATVTGMTVGTPAYMAPEQAVGKNIGPHSDVYGAGIIAYELLTGATPFEDAETPVAMLYRHVHDDPTPPTAVRPEIHPHLEQWVLSLLAKRPEERPTADGARQQLDEILAEELGARWRVPLTLSPEPPPRASDDLFAIGPIETVPVNGATPEPSTHDGTTDEGIQAGRASNIFQTFVPRLSRRRERAEPPATAAAAQSLPTTVDIPSVGTRANVDDPGATQPSLRAAPLPSPPTSAPPARRLTSRRAVASAVAAVAVTTIGWAATQLGGPDPPTTSAIVADDTPTSPIAVAIDGDHAVVTDPAGRVLRVGTAQLNTTAQAREPFAPRAALPLADGVLIADSGGITMRHPGSLAARWAVPTGPDTWLGTSPALPLVAFRQGTDNGRLCEVTPTGALSPCVVLGFAPTGLGGAGSNAVVADGAGNQLVIFDVSVSALTRRSTIPVGKAPHGPIATDGAGRAVIAIERGLVVVNPTTATMSATVPLQTTPSNVTINRSNGEVLAALPGSNAVAIVDPNRPDRPARVIDVGRRPLAVGVDNTGTRALIVNANGSMGSLKIADGEVDRRVPLPTIPADVGPATVTAVATRRAGLITTTTLTLDRPLDAHGLSGITGAISRGSAVVSLWQGGINAQRPTVNAKGIRFAFSQRPGRLRIRISAPRDRFQSLSARLMPDGRRVVLTFTAPPPPPPRRITPPTVVSPGGSQKPTRPPASPPTPEPIIVAE